ncbi:MAG: hypothetical protein ABJC74_13170 [Gemmatimonadota bacterium]
MRLRNIVLTAGAVALVVLGLACSDSSGPGNQIRPPAELRVVQLPVTHPPFLADSVTFIAVKGQNTQASIYFADEEGGQGDEYLRLQLNGHSLKAYPDGTPMVDGDSVRITLRVVDSDSILFQFEPSGLAFDSAHPAKLKIRFAQCGGDYNDDGHVGQDDAAILAELAIWRQPLLSDPYTRLGSVRVDDDEGVEADLTGFSRYALAY